MSNGQQSHDERKVKFNTFLGIGRSTFHTNISAPSKFPTAEIRLGAGVTRKLNRTFDIKSGLRFGVKLKRSGFNDEGIVVVGAPFMQLDDLSSDRDHYFYEIPLSLQANVIHPRMGLKAGINYKRFFPDNARVDALTARGDLGLLGGVSYRFDKNFSVDVDYCMGLTNMIVSGGSVNGEEYLLKVKNNFVQFGINYAMGK